MTEEQLQQLRDVNEKLRDKNEFARDFFINQAREEGYEPDFFGTVKPFTDEVTELTVRWEELVEPFVQEYKPNQLYTNQITQTVDNFETVAIKSFYGNTSLKRQLETFKSIKYVLSQVDEALNNLMN
ncbi:YppE family protein [Alkalihalobacillus sp. 1P02AB]|uniref:YppE family protein n=1 Tax=Alkalihalobacillus sp. 1P02AB TaxID=3132260 RepID=UPI0039A483A8